SLFQRARKLSQDLRDEVADARKSHSITPDFKRKALQELAKAKKLRNYYLIFRTAAIRFQDRVREFDKLQPVRAKFLVSEIDTDFALRNVRMLQRLRELIEDAYLVQVEIYNGASEDIVWANAHPGY